MTDVTFRAIPGFGDYEVSQAGVVRRRVSGCVLRGRDKRDRAVQLHRGGITYYRLRRDLVALTWSECAPEPEPEPVEETYQTEDAMADDDDSGYRPIPGYDNYEINLYGIVRRRENGRVILPCGRLRNSITLYQHGRQIYAKLADLVPAVWGRPMLVTADSVAEAAGETPAMVVAPEGGDELARLRDQLAATQARARMLEVENNELRATLAACGVL